MNSGKVVVLDKTDEIGLSSFLKGSVLSKAKIRLEILGDLLNNKLERLLRRPVDFWNFRISRGVTVPGLYTKVGN